MPTILSEDFNTGDGGWTTNADARDFTHVPLSGADGGYVEAFDRVSGDVWYFVGGAARCRGRLVPADDADRRCRL